MPRPVLRLARVQIANAGCGEVHMKQEGRVVVITGAAGGIGRALVDIVAADGDIVIAVDLPGSGVS